VIDLWEWRIFVHEIETDFFENFRQMSKQSVIASKERNDYYWLLDIYEFGLKERWQPNINTLHPMLELKICLAIDPASGAEYWKKCIQTSFSGELPLS